MTTTPSLVRRIRGERANGARWSQRRMRRYCLRCRRLTPHKWQNYRDVRGCLRCGLWRSGIEIAATVVR